MIFDLLTPTSQLSAELAIQAFRLLAKRYPEKAEVFRRLLGLPAEPTMDERIAKIETARVNLVEALSAIEELKQAAENHQRDLAKVAAALQKVQAEKASAAGELATLKQMAELDIQAVRRVIGLPSAVAVWRERIIGFVIVGVLASIVASAAWELWLKPAVEGAMQAPAATQAPVDTR
jgi:chromosome segregation ATPase